MVSLVSCQKSSSEKSQSQSCQCYQMVMTVCALGCLREHSCQKARSPATSCHRSCPVVCTVYHTLLVVLEMPWLIKEELHLLKPSSFFAAGMVTFPLVVSRDHEGFTNAFHNFDWYLTRELVTLSDPASLYLQSKNSTWQKNLEINPQS